ncbi:membrane protein YdbS with pleckstrin-like domain [Catenuloplanes nepalensis]|uniref:Membrane protein YdbS with pleckstrin-like domain n=1 Tax=Catenuloplanes nepalensis TaxID=587533 RepID=A0ABT9MPZ5_9ACTN|nr:PH domain-containing protein [Catenuloplanes nepalensis]MDP9793485.1 membrane protein YdbS with pleckstrin-like domain [Catenuloplanes nepalensis]
MNGVEIILALLLGVLVNEFTGVSPWLGRRLAAWSARLRYGDTPRGKVRAEELEAVIEARPGSFLKLATGTNLAVASLVMRARRLIAGEPDPADAPSADEVLSAPRRVLPLDDEPTTLVARYLFPTERYRGEWKRHWINPARSALVVVIYGVLLEWIVAIYVRDRYQVWCALLVALATAVLVLYQLALWYFNRLIITNKRLMLTRGVARRTVAMMPLMRVVDVRYVQSPLGRVLGYGTFRLESASRRNAMRVVADVPRPNELYLRIVEEMYEPEAVEARLGRDKDDLDLEPAGLAGLPPFADEDLTDREFAEQGFAEQGFAEQGFAEQGFAEQDLAEQDLAEQGSADRRESPGTMPGSPWASPPIRDSEAEMIALLTKLGGAMESLTAAVDRLTASAAAQNRPREGRAGTDETDTMPAPPG